MNRNHIGFVVLHPNTRLIVGPVWRFLFEAEEAAVTAGFPLSAVQDAFVLEGVAHG